MNPKAREIFTLAAVMAPEKRESYLAEACGDDAELRLEVQKMLVDARNADSLFGSDDDEVATIVGEEFDATYTEAEGDEIGSYTLRQQIGEGGFGVVWMAEQSGAISRMVALKVVKAGMDTKQVLARFEAERQALAMMDHPNIAKVLDAGASPTGRPYFVMELVRGMPITAFCDQQKFGPRQRLELFRDVCSAINHAHQKGIIHRDLKPSNIMVTLEADRPVVKVIDFGIAKATHNKLTEKTLFTRFEQFLGTPAYMSPEQAAMSNLDVDTRSDIYSLGVLLYELLAGAPPFDSKSLLSAGYDEMRRIIAEDEPPRPSTRCTQTQANTGMTSGSKPKKFHVSASALKGELDWIVMKAIEKDRTRRYETANAFAADIGRYLANEPVQAAAPSAAYKFRKFARRNKAALVVAAAMLVLLLGGIAATSWQAVRATSEKQNALKANEVARQRLHETEAILEFLTGMFESSRPGEKKGGREVKVADVLDRAMKKLESELADQPMRKTQLQNTLARTYFDLGLYPQAIDLQETALAYHLAHSGPEHPDTLATKINLASFYSATARWKESIQLGEEVLPQYLKNLGPEHPTTLMAMSILALCYASAGRLDEAITMGEDVLALRRKTLGPEDPDTISDIFNLAAYYRKAGRRDEAVPMEEKVLVLRRKVLGAEHRQTLEAMSNLAGSYSGAGREDEAIPMQEEVLALLRKVLGPKHPDTLGSINNLAASYSKAGRLEEAIPMQEEALALFHEVLESEHPDTLAAMHNLALLYQQAGRWDEALPLHKEVLALCRKVLGPERPDTLDVMASLAIAYKETGRPDEAIPLEKEGLALRRKVLGPEHPDTLSLMDSLARSYARADRLDDAKAILLELLALRRKVLGPEHPDTKAMVGVLYSLIDEQFGSEGDESVEKAIAFGKLHVEMAPEDADMQYDLGILLVSENRLEEAVSTLRAASKLYPGGPRGRLMREHLSKVLTDLDRDEEAAEVRRELARFPTPLDAEAPAVVAVLVDPSAEWKWLHPLDGIDPKESDPDFHTTFFTPKFDAANWQSGRDSDKEGGGFGYGDDWLEGVDIGLPSLVDEDGKRKGKGAYFRHRFTTEKRRTNLELRCQRDDGIVIYLDGKEVARDNMQEGEEAYLLPAADAVAGDDETTTYRIPLKDVTLAPGEHVLAISLHNATNPSSDLRIGGISLVEVAAPEAP